MLSSIQPEVSFDIIFIMNKIKHRITELSIFELNSLLYFALLLSIYDGKNISDWKYKFSYHKYGGPFSTDVYNNLKLLLSNNFVSKNNDFYKLTSNCFNIEIYSNLRRFSWRTNYLNISIDSTLGYPFPKAINSIQEEPGIKNAQKNKHRLALHSNTDFINDYFKSLKKALGDKENLWLIAKIWINYLMTITDLEEGED